MKHSTRLADLLQSTFGLHRARVTCLAALVIALFRVKTVSLAQLATAFPGSAEIDSHYRRLQRFFQYLQLQPARVATFVLAFLPDAPYTLALDRTQWMLGRMPINFLVLSVVHDGIAFPLFWRLLDKKGNSNTQERIDLLAQFLKVLGSDKIDCLVADREFIGRRVVRLAQSQSHPLLHPNPPRHEGVADHRSLVTRTQLLQKPAPYDFMLLDRCASGVWPLALGKRYAPALRGLSDRGVESSGASSPGGL